jgi:putative hydrolase of HD superfamily
MQGVANVLGFIIEVEQLKAVIRKTKPVGLDRYENSAEHSWHVCLSALMLKDYAKLDIDINRVIKMLLIHDLGEIDAGDTIIYASETVENKLKEEAGIVRLLSILPSASQQEYLALWREFEQGKTSDAVFAKAVDRIPPLLHNLNGGGHSWNKHQISKEQVLALNSARISAVLPDVWQELERQLTLAAEQGIFEE